MNEIYLTSIKTLAKDRAELIEKLDEIFKDCQLVMSISYRSTQYYPIKNIKHFIKNSPTYKASAEDLIVLFYPVGECLMVKNTKTGIAFAIRLAEKKYLEDFPYIYEGELDKKNDYIIPIKFK